MQVAAKRIAAMELEGGLTLVALALDGIHPGQDLI